MNKILLKRKHSENIADGIVSSPQPPNKKKMVQWVANSVSDDEASPPLVPQAAALALLELSQTAMKKWTHCFDESSSSGSDEDEEGKASWRSKEDKMVKSLVKATFQAAASSFSPVVNPDVFLQSLIFKQTAHNVEYHKASDLERFFEPVTASKTAAYTLELCKAVRSDDVATVRRLYAQGHCMEASNKFGDSIVHLACRRNSERVLSFLLQTCQVPCKLVCDYGRTPLHDACWTTSPNYTIIGMILDVCPDLLYVKDARGSTAFEYLKKQFWPEMCAFLQDRPITCLLPKEL